jgi:hypothetical protein
MSQHLILHERTREDGSLERTFLETDGDALYLHLAEETKAIVPLAFLDGVMRRYGKPLEDGVPLPEPRLRVGDRTIGMLRYRPRYDVIAKDYVVYAVGDDTPLVELATSVSAALAYLLRRAETTESQS